MKNCEYHQIDPQAPSTPNPTLPPPINANKKVIRARRKWQAFPGRNRFYCDGRIIVARQSGVLPLTLGLILVTSTLFFIFDCPFLVEHLTSCIPVIGGVLFVFVVISLLQTSFTDPGILPRAGPDEAADIERQIERFDHHCPWVGNCVGKRNYRFFYSFIVSLSFLTAFIFGCVTTHLAMRSQGGKGIIFALQQSPASAIELVVCFFSVWSILGLSGFHTYLVASNLTTNEDIKGSWSGKSGSEGSRNPYSYNNIFMNCCAVLCGPMPPSLIDRRGFLPPEEALPAATEIDLPSLEAKNDINMVGGAS